MVSNKRTKFPKGNGTGLQHHAMFIKSLNCLYFKEVGMKSLEKICSYLNCNPCIGNSVFCIVPTHYLSYRFHGRLEAFILLPCRPTFVYMILVYCTEFVVGNEGYLLSLIGC